MNAGRPLLLLKEEEALTSHLPSVKAFSKALPKEGKVIVRNDSP
jgi:hypothetical protein